MEDIKETRYDRTGTHMSSRDCDCKHRTCTGARQMGSSTETGRGLELPSLMPKLSPTDNHFQRGKTK